MKYAVVIERGPTSFGASVPDLPGCFAVGETLEEAERLIARIHDREDGAPVDDLLRPVDAFQVDGFPRPVNGLDENVPHPDVSARAVVKNDVNGPALLDETLQA